MSERGNLVDQVRPMSTFENFEVYDDRQREAVDNLTRLADSIVEKQAAVAASEYPFAAAKIVFLWSPPGRGKTHLVEAIVNRVRQRAPKIVHARRLYLSRYNFTYLHQVGADTYGKAPIVVNDDMYSEYQSASDLHQATDVPALMRWVASVYERRTLSICTSNFPLMRGIAEVVRRVDKQGRVLSRLEEMLANSGEIELPGRDYRSTVAQKNKGSLFTV